MLGESGTKTHGPASIAGEFFSVRTSACLFSDVMASWTAFVKWLG